MLAEIKTVYSRSSQTILQDAIGAVALLLMLGVALYLPSLL